MQPGVVDVLRAAGHSVYDFRNGQTAFSWRDVGSVKDVASFRKALASDEADAAWALDKSAMQDASLCVLVVTAGASAHFEAGWCKGSHIPLIVHMPDDVQPELVYREAEALTCTDDELLEACAWWRTFPCWRCSKHTSNGKASAASGGKCIACGAWHDAWGNPQNKFINSARPKWLHEAQGDKP